MSALCPRGDHHRSLPLPTNDALLAWRKCRLLVRQAAVVDVEIGSKDGLALRLSLDPFARLSEWRSAMSALTPKADTRHRWPLCATTNGHPDWPFIDDIRHPRLSEPKVIIRSLWVFDATQGH
jgi:hypothetical protein